MLNRLFLRYVLGGTTGGAFAEVHFVIGVQIGVIPACHLVVENVVEFFSEGAEFVNAHTLDGVNAATGHSECGLREFFPQG